jgi:hypothetical protein
VNIEPAQAVEIENSGAKIKDFYHASKTSCHPESRQRREEGPYVGRDPAPT